MKWFNPLYVIFFVLGVALEVIGQAVDEGTDFVQTWGKRGRRG